MSIFQKKRFYVQWFFVLVFLAGSEAQSSGVNAPSIFQVNFSGSTVGCSALESTTFLTTPALYTELVPSVVFSFVSQSSVTFTVIYPYFPEAVRVFVVFVSAETVVNGDIFEMGSCDSSSNVEYVDWITPPGSLPFSRQPVAGNNLLAAKAGQSPYNNTLANGWIALPSSACSTTTISVTKSLSTLLACTTASGSSVVSVINGTSGTSIFSGNLVIMTVGLTRKVDDDSIVTYETFYVHYSINVTAGVSVIAVSGGFITLANVSSAATANGPVFVCKSSEILSSAQLFGVIFSAIVGAVLVVAAALCFFMIFGVGRKRKTHTQTYSTVSEG